MSVSSLRSAISRPAAPLTLDPMTMLPTMVAAGPGSGCFWRGCGRLVTHECGHIRMLAGCSVPSRNACLVSWMWTAPELVCEIYRNFSAKFKKYILSSFHPFKVKCVSKVVRIWLYNHLSSEWAMKSHVLHTVWCYISGEAAGEIWHWSLLGVKGDSRWLSTLKRAEFSQLDLVFWNNRFTVVSRGADSSFHDLCHQNCQNVAPSESATNFDHSDDVNRGEPIRKGETAELW